MLCWSSPFFTSPSKKHESYPRISLVFKSPALGAAVEHIPIPIESKERSWVRVLLRPFSFSQIISIHTRTFNQTTNLPFKILSSSFPTPQVLLLFSRRKRDRFSKFRYSLERVAFITEDFPALAKAKIIINDDDDNNNNNNVIIINSLCLGFENLNS